MDASPEQPGPPALETPTGSPLGRVPVRQPGRGFRTVAGLVTAFLLLAIAKPWDWGAASPPPPVVVRPPVVASSSPGPSSITDRSPESLAADVCLGTGAWRVATLETWRLVIRAEVVTQRVRVWRAVEPTLAATGPDDPRIPIVGVAAMQVDALGWCAPAGGSGHPVGPVVVTVWRLPDLAQRGGSLDAEPLRVRRIAPGQGENAIAALYREVTDCVAGFGCSGSGVPLLAEGWAAGRYVFEYHDTGTRATWWFGADVVVLPAPA
jgi:hypothetical protein